MAFTNVSKPSGLSPTRYLNGAMYNGKVNQYCILAADTNAFYPGDLVTPIANGDSNGVPGVTLAAAAGVAIGVVVAVGLIPQGGPYINMNNLAVTARPAAAQAQIWYVAVSDDPNIIYSIQEGGAGTNLTQTSCNRNANILYAAPAAGVAVSGTVLNNASVAVTATLNLKIMRLIQAPDNHFSTSPTTGGAGQKWEVLINNHYLRGGVTSL